MNVRSYCISAEWIVHFYVLLLSSAFSSWILSRKNPKKTTNRPTNIHFNLHIKTAKRIEKSFRGKIYNFHGNHIRFEPRWNLLPKKWRKKMKEKTVRFFSCLTKKKGKRILETIKLLLVIASWRKHFWPNPPNYCPWLLHITSSKIIDIWNFYFIFIDFIDSKSPFKFEIESDSDINVSAITSSQVFNYESQSQNTSPSKPISIRDTSTSLESLTSLELGNLRDKNDLVDPLNPKKKKNHKTIKTVKIEMVKAEQLSELKEEYSDSSVYRIANEGLSPSSPLSLQSVIFVEPDEEPDNEPDVIPNVKLHVNADTKSDS